VVLVDLIVRDVGQEPGNLPLLSHALLETWHRRRGHMMILESYSESGGVRGAIAKTAETIYKHLDTEQQGLARTIFLRLKELGDGTPDTRRRADLTEVAPTPAMVATLKVLIDAHLVTSACRSNMAKLGVSRSVSLAQIPKRLGLMAYLEPSIVH